MRYFITLIWSKFSGKIKVPICSAQNTATIVRNDWNTDFQHHTKAQTLVGVFSHEGFENVGTAVIKYCWRF